MTDYTNYTKSKFRKEINEIIKNNKDVKAQKSRAVVVSQYNGSNGLLLNLNERAVKTDSGDLSEYNEYRWYLLLKLYNWVLRGTYPEPKDYYVNERYLDTPSEIGENMDTNSKIYRGKSNYYTKPKVTPRKSEIKDSPRIAEAVNDLKEARKLKGNRFKKSKAIHAAKMNLHDILVSYRGIDEFNRVDNTVTPQQSIKAPNFDSPDYLKFLLKTSLEELRTEDVRQDKINVDKTLGDKPKIFKDLEQGYTEAEVAKMNHRSRSSISRQLNTTTKHLIKIFN